MAKKSFSYNSKKSELLIDKFEKYLNRENGGYFDVEQISEIIDYYLSDDNFENANLAFELGEQLHVFSEELELSRAKIELSAGKPASALSTLENISNGDYLEISFTKLEVLLQLDNKEEANKLTLDILDSIDRDEADNVCHDIANIYFEATELTDALYWYKKGIKYNPNNIQILLDLANLYIVFSRHKDAELCNIKIIDIDPYTHSAWYNLGLIYGYFQPKSDLIKALESFDYALAIDEDDTLALYHKIVFLSKLKMYEEELKYIDELLDKWDNKNDVLLMKAECLENLEKYTDAINTYLLISTQESEQLDSYLGLSYCYLQLNEYEHSLEYSLKAIELDIQNCEAWIAKGDVLSALSRNSLALEAYQKALDIDPNQSDVLLSIADIYIEIGDYYMAERYYEQAYDFDNSIENIELLIAIASYRNQNIIKMLDFLQRAENRNLDAVKIFISLCPEAEQFFSEK